MPLFTLNRATFERDGKRRGLIPYLGDFAKMFRMKNHFKILSMAVESGGGRGTGMAFYKSSDVGKELYNFGRLLPHNIA